MSRHRAGVIRLQQASDAACVERLEVGMAIFTDEDRALGYEEPADALYDVLTLGLIASVALLALYCVLQATGAL